MEYKNSINSFSYRTSKMLTDISKFSVGALSCISPFIMPEICPVIIGGCVIWRFNLEAFKLELYSNEVRNIRAAYNEIVKNSANLIQSFGFDNPVAISTLYSELLYDGYLSYDDNFKCSSANPIDIYNLHGAEVVDGRGVCRHISCMLKDILNQLDIRNEISVIEFKDDYFRFFSNHAINVVAMNNQFYLLDPTNNMLWEYIGNKLITAQKDEREYVASTMKLLDRLSINMMGDISLKELKQIFKLQQYNVEEGYDIIEKTKLLYTDNLDIFEQFKNNNRYLTEEVHSNFCKIRKK